MPKVDKGRENLATIKKVVAPDERVAKIRTVQPHRGESKIEEVAEAIIDEMIRDGWDHYETAIQGPELWYLFFRRELPSQMRARA